MLHWRCTTPTLRPVPTKVSTGATVLLAPCDIACEVKGNIGVNGCTLDSRARLAAFILAVAVVGCTTFTNYPRRMASVRRQFEDGEALAAAESMTEAVRRATGRLCWLLERGMILHSAGRYDASNAAFFGAEKVITELDDRAVVSARDSAAGAMTLVLNEKAAPYRGEGFERVLLNTYLAFNFLMAGELTDARVEVRKAYERQQLEADRHAHALEEARRYASANGFDLDAGMQKVRGGYGERASAASRVQNAYQNAFTYYLSAIVYELNGETNDAYVDLKHAVELRPQASCIQRDLVRHATRLGFHDELATWKERFGDLELPPGEYGSILVVFEDGMAPVKEEIKLPIPTEFGILFMALPAYRVHRGGARPMDIAVDGMLLGRTQVMADVEGMAVRNLDDKLPVLFVKQMVRTAAKGVVAKQVYDDDPVAGVLLSTVGTLMTEQADLRGWITLPRDIQVSRIWVEPAVRSVELNIAGIPRSDSWRVEVPVERRRTTVVNARYTGRHMYLSVSRPLG